MPIARVTVGERPNDSLDPQPFQNLLIFGDIKIVIEIEKLVTDHSTEKC